MSMTFEWSPVKAIANIRRHGVEFEEATSAFADPLSLTSADPDHSASEQRWVLVGLSFKGRLLVVVHTDINDTVRLISARTATPALLSRGLTMRAEYDFSKGVRGKYTDRLTEGVKLVVLDPDVAEAFPTSDQVNEALRRLAKEPKGVRPRTTSLDS